MSHPKLTIALTQINPLMADVVGNVRKIREAYLEADGRGVDLAVFPELCLTGSPLEGLADNGDLPGAVEEGLEALCDATRDRKAALLVGGMQRDGDKFFSTALVFSGGRVAGYFRRRGLPGDGGPDGAHGTARTPRRARVTRVYEFVNQQAREADEAITDATEAVPVTIHGVKVGVLVGWDTWRPDAAARFKKAGAELLVSINACPFRPKILETRIRDVAALRVSETKLPLVYVNAVGGQDQTVFDGGSFVLDAHGRRLVQLPQWEECAMDCELDRPFEASGDVMFSDPSEDTYRALMLGLGDYVKKSGFTDVVLGLSGGMDSALVAAIAGDALGPERVHCVRLPSRHTSDLSNDTAAAMCETWGFGMDTVPIGAVVDAAADAVTPAAPRGLNKLTGENMQARARGYLLMTISNNNNWLLLATGNKSEGSVGYATLYGDMCGGYAPLKDVFKTTVYALARWRNANRPDGFKGPEGTVIPTEIIDRAPSAELAPNQLDTDSLPPYPVLDAILAEMVEKGTPVSLLAAEKGFDPELVDQVYRMHIRSEYKRRQGAPGPMLSELALSGWRPAPIINRFDPTMREQLRELED